MELGHRNERLSGGSWWLTGFRLDLVLGFMLPRGCPTDAQGEKVSCLKVSPVFHKA